MVTILCKDMVYNRNDNEEKEFVQNIDPTNNVPEGIGYMCERKDIHKPDVYAGHDVCGHTSQAKRHHCASNITFRVCETHRFISTHTAKPVRREMRLTGFCVYMCYSASSVTGT